MGPTTISAGTLTLAGAGGTLGNSSGCTINGGLLAVDNVTANADRLRNSGACTLSLGGELKLSYNAAANTTEPIAK